MSRPTTKAELLTASAAEYQRLQSLVDGALASPARADASPIEGLVRDLLGHLHAWHLMMITWYEVGSSGGTPVIPAPGFTWRTLPELNEEIRLRLQGVDVASVRSDLEATHRRLMNIVAGHTDAELFTKSRYGWTGSTSLGAYLVSATSSHYAWAVKELRKGLRAQGA